MSCTVGQSLDTLEITKANQLGGFYNAGTTVQLRAVYKNYSDDKTQKKQLSFDKIQLLKVVLGNTKIKKHRQKKIAGIYAAVELCSNENCHCLLLTDSVAYDITANLEYHFLNENLVDLQNILKND